MKIPNDSKRQLCMFRTALIPDSLIPQPTPMPQSMYVTNAAMFQGASTKMPAALVRGNDWNYA
jgi:hypothetical protein